MKRSNLIKISTAAKLRKVKRQTMYYHVRQHNLAMEDIDGTMYVDRVAVMALPLRRENTPNKKKPDAPKTKK